ncbi:pyruvate formate lyase family protein, partial [Verrucomicrobiota bacterium]
LFYLLFLLNGHDSPGPVDRYLFPSLKRDFDSGALSRDEARMIVDCLWLKFEEQEAFGATVGGRARSGADASNELTLLCIDSIRRLRLLSPRTALRWHPGLSARVFEKAIDCVADGCTYPAFVNDEAIIAAMVDRGVAREDAREYTFVGCGQTYPHGRGHGNYEDVIINSAKPLEWALHDGVDPTTGKQEGPATGDPRDFGCYEAFEAAYRRQMDRHISQAIEAVNDRRRRAVGQAHDFLRSLLTRSCVERGLDWHAGGADYSEGMVDMVGLTTVIDSLLAIKLCVFEGKQVSLEKLVQTLDRDWEGQEALRLFLLNKVPKFGNNLPEADAPAVAELGRVNGFIRSHRTVFDGPWGMDIVGWSGAVEMGKVTGATPDGRRRGEPLADCAGPAQGRNVSGLTASLLSMTGLPNRKVHGPLALSLRFPKSAVEDAEGRAKLGAAVRAYFEMGGQQVQISIAGTEDMKAAQRNPEAYRSLMVRVGGFSAYFTRLGKAFQDDMIARSECEL